MLCLIGRLLHRTTSLRSRDISDLPNKRNKHRELGKVKRERNIIQMKEPDKTSEKELNKMEISNYLIKSSR